MPLIELEYTCAVCGSTVKKPGYLGRSWCRNCDMYNAVKTEEKQPEDGEGESKPEGMDHAYTYTTWRPKPNSFKFGENPSHRFAYVKRSDRLVKGPRGDSFKAKCTCGSWNNPNGFTSKRIALMHFNAHLAEAEKQQSLL